MSWKYTIIFGAKSHCVSRPLGRHSSKILTSSNTSSIHLFVGLTSSSNRVCGSGFCWLCPRHSAPVHGLIITISIMCMIDKVHNQYMSDRILMRANMSVCLCVCVCVCVCVRARFCVRCIFYKHYIFCDDLYND